MPTAGAQPTGTPRVSRGYAVFVHHLCRSLAAADAAAIRSLLPYYQYNSGVRFGTFGGGEGETGDPAIISSWLAGGRVRCRSYTRDIAGHGTLLAGGWNVSGGWALLDLDTFGGVWKVNDFTFGRFHVLFHAMRTFHSVLRYHD